MTETPGRKGYRRVIEAFLFVFNYYPFYKINKHEKNNFIIHCSCNSYYSL